jgi:hypothetical protein
MNKIFKNSVALDGNPEPDLVHATGCKQPTLKKIGHINVLIQPLLEPHNERRLKKNCPADLREG